MSKAGLPTAKPMNLVMQISASQKAIGNIRLLSCNQTVAHFTYYINQGTHTYVIRLSSDYNYWDIRTDALVIENDPHSDITKMCLMSDDGKYYDLIE